MLVVLQTQRFRIVYSNTVLEICPLIDKWWINAALSHEYDKLWNNISYSTLPLNGGGRILQHSNQVSNIYFHELMGGFQKQNKNEEGK